VIVSLTGSVLSNDPLLDIDLRDLNIVTLSSGSYLFGTTGPNGGLVSYALQPGQSAILADQQIFSIAEASAAQGFTSHITPFGPNQAQLAFGSTVGSNGTWLVGYELDQTGHFQTLSQVLEIPAEARDLSTVVNTSINGMQVLYATGSQINGVLAYHLDPLTQTYVALAAEASAPTSSLTLLTAVDSAGQPYLLALDPGNNAVHSYQISSQTGALVHLDTSGAADGLGISAPTVMETITAFGQTWVILGAAGSQSLSVMLLTDTGALQPVDHVLDTRFTRFGNIQALAVTETDDHVFIIAGGGDDGLSVFTLLPNGRLVHLETLVNGDMPGLGNVSQISAAVIGNEIQVFVASGSEAGLTQFTIALDGLGTVLRDLSAGSVSLSGTALDDMLVAQAGGTDTLNGGAGDDILVAAPGNSVLWGGQGADLFVIQIGAQLTQIMDFTPGEDQLDLSDLPMLRGIGQLTTQMTSDGLQITFRNTVIELHSATGIPFDITAVFGNAFSWPDRILPPASLLGITVVGTPNGEFIPGTDGNDTLDGAAGDDNLWAREGDDRLIGNAGNDSLGGQGGDDTLFGWMGNDMLAGGTGNDSLDGGIGLDQLWGGTGNDTILGRAGNDTLGGYFGDDRLEGGDGNDDHWGAWGNDTILGGADDDMLGGYYGDDLLFGGEGRDQLWGAWGRDEAHGGAGDDTIGGGTEDDTLYGDAGNDLIFGGTGNDLLDGGDGNDELWGSTGDDLYTGGAGADTFFFSSNAGQEQITDFEVGLDNIHIFGPGLTFETLNMVQQGADVVIVLDTGQITLNGILLGDLSALDFGFG
jgi:Ca2+-binding RTX toxin-like protein